MRCPEVARRRLWKESIMAKGGARNRSGPPSDPGSERSERRGYKLTALPSSGYDGEAPAWPMPERQIFKKVSDLESGFTTYEFDAAGTKAVAEREASLWSWAWSLPQACAWSMPSEAWRLQTIAMWVRTFVICEGSDATAADKNSLHRFADQIGMTPAGLRENGWAISTDEVGAKSREKEAEKKAEQQPAAPQRRMRAVSGDS